MATKTAKTFTEGQAVMVTRGNDKGRTGKVYGIVGTRYVISFDADGRYATSGIVSAASLKAI